ncbi:MAG: hypothetical protein LAT67_05175 [Balneolales bacterium]|nr:hypothetical protein [Balneolales bacterium]
MLRVPASFYVLLLLLMFAAGFIISRCSHQPEIPDPVIHYIPESHPIERMFNNPARFRPVLNTVFIVRIDTTREERTVYLPTGFSNQLLISEPNPIRIRNNQLHYRYFSTETNQLQIDRFTLPEKRWRIGTNIDFLNPASIAFNPYITYRGFGLSALAHLQRDSIELYYGFRVNYEF